MSTTLNPPRQRPQGYPTPPQPPRGRRPVSQPKPANPKRRLRLAGVVCLLILVAFVVKLFYVQALSAPTFAGAATKSRSVTNVLPAVRGTITDATGIALATTVESRNITADQTLIKDPQATAEILAPMIGKSVSSVRARLSGERRFVYVAKGITPKKWDQIKEMGIAGIFSEGTSTRVYPAKSVAANVIGFVGADGAGLGGLELSLQSTLSGTPGKQTVERGAGGRQIPSGTDKVTPALNGSDVRLTIDRDIQWVAQQAIAAKVAESGAQSGTVVVMDPRTGNILAMATAPTFNPNKPSASKGSLRGNRAVTDIYEPGSTSKIMTAAAVIEEGKLKANSKITVPPVLVRGGSTFNDSEKHGTLRLTFAGVLAKSSNIGTIQASEKIGAKTLYSYLKKFGIAEPSGLNFPGESRGLLPALKNWSGTSFPTIAFGQGLSLNSIQATSVFATIANGGVRVEPRLVAGTTGNDGKFVEAAQSRRVEVVSPATARTVTDMLESVVSDGGTAPMARIPGYRVAGKTGTANRVDPACGCYRGYTASFIGFAPADNPQLVVSVTLQAPKRGHYGGMLGGPVFKRVMSFALQDQRIPPTGSKAPALKLTW